MKVLLAQAYAARGVTPVFLKGSPLARRHKAVEASAGEAPEWRPPRGS